MREPAKNCANYAYAQFCVVFTKQIKHLANYAAQNSAQLSKCLIKKGKNYANYAPPKGGLDALWALRRPLGRKSKKPGINNNTLVGGWC